MNVLIRHLHPAIQRWLHRLEEVSATLSDTQTERTRARIVSDTVFDEFGISAPAGVDRTTHHIPSPDGTIRIDEYRPSDADASLPAYLHFHGGAFRLGELDEHVNVAFCAKRALDARYAVYSLDYSLAPERPHPAAQIDTMLALEWLVEHAADLAVDPARIVIGGVSAGGALAAALCIAARDAGYRIRGQLLEVPVVDMRPSATWLSEYGPLNGLPSAEDVRNGYIQPGEADSPVVSPLLADLRDLPPTHVMTAELDPLRDMGEQFVSRLRDAGNDVTGTRHLGALHGTQGLFKVYRDARLWHDEVTTILRDFARTTPQA